MRRISLTLTLVLVLAAAGAEAGERDGATIVHSEEVRQMVIRRLASGAPAAAAVRAPVEMGFDALGRHFDLSLESNVGLLSPETMASLDDDLSVLRGRIDGRSGSWARIVLANGQPRGMLYDGNELLAIEPAADPGGAPRIFRLADLLIEPGAMSCGVDSEPATGQQMVEALVAEFEPPVGRAAGAVEEIEIGALGDSVFAAAHGDPVQEILTRINNVDGIFSAELGIQITVPNNPTVFNDASDPFTATTNPDDLLTELRDFRANSAAQQQLGLTHLFTGRTLNGSTVGIAFIGVLCDTQFGVGLSESTGGVTVDSLIAAHEIGHNFGASHDGEAGGSCPLEPPNDFIMATRVNGNPEFSGCSKSVMLDEAANAACIQALPALDMRITSFEQPETILLGNTLSLTFAINNRGSSPASDVIVDIALPSNVTLLSSGPSQGSCASGAGQLTCSLGAVAGISSATVSLALSTVDTGNAAFQATVTAPGDEFAENDEDTHVVAIEPAVNLGVSSPAAVSVNIGENVMASLSIANTAILDATGVTVVIGAGPGLSPSAATWTAGDCSISGADVVCTAAALPAGAGSTLDIELLANSAGNRAYSIELAASEADADETDNTAQGSITVIDPSRSPDDEGGGSTGILLLLLGAALGWRRRLRG